VLGVLRLPCTRGDGWCVGMYRVLGDVPGGVEGPVDQPSAWAGSVLSASVRRGFCHPQAEQPGMKTCTGSPLACHVRGIQGTREG
jgi:hypothetical protein